jgi:dCTP deaminase
MITVHGKSVSHPAEHRTRILDHHNATVLNDVEIMWSVKMKPFFCGPQYAQLLHELWGAEVPDHIHFDPQKQPISRGLTSMGYDLTLSTQYKLFTNLHSAVVDPLAFDPRAFVDMEGDHCIIPPHSFMLSESVERIEMPPDVIAICVGKSTYARCGLSLNVTPLEPGWQGTVTLEVSNNTPNPAKIYANMGVGQLIFLRHQHGCARSYADKKGKYQDQRGIALPKGDAPTPAVSTADSVAREPYWRGPSDAYDVH